ncbi:hypothetical protein [Hymenobacter volaticus]|uniref:Uncharacterized protein n=1 Tax=Hymenobacter volaticus TaxID=2932254 RepID=A0ABY4G8S1_9BACT|nr:hypothetical protein [Hymenobacter volaticus]UOQ67304.1 hypothetical protein MUN86_05305 [Hymenobacter volaticus]
MALGLTIFLTSYLLHYGRHQRQSNSLLIGWRYSGHRGWLITGPETGDKTRAGLKESAGKLGDDLNKLLKDGLSRFSSKEQNPASAQQESDRSAADSLLGSINTPGGFTEPDAGSIGISTLTTMALAATPVIFPVMAEGSKKTL